MATTLLDLPAEIIHEIVVVQILKSYPFPREQRKSSVDSLLCTCKALNKAVGNCITRAILEPEAFMHASFPSHLFMFPGYLSDSLRTAFPSPLFKEGRGLLFPRYGTIKHLTINRSEAQDIGLMALRAKQMQKSLKMCGHPWPMR
jgi:hypothetical protein